MIDHDDPKDHTIYVTCDASECGTCVKLSFEMTWEAAHPVTFEPAQLSSAEWSYPVHEKELLSIVKALS